MAFAQSQPMNAFKTFTATPSSGLSGNSNSSKPVKEIVVMPDEEPVYGPPSSVSTYSEYELGLNVKPSLPTSNSTPGQMNMCANNIISPPTHDLAPPPYHQYIAQQQQQRQMLQQQQYPVVTARCITSPSDQVITNSYAEVVFHQRSGVRKNSDFSSSTGSRGMRPPPSPQPRPPIPAHSPNSKVRTYSDSSNNGLISSSSQPPPPPPHGRPLSGSISQHKSSPSPFSSAALTYTTSAPIEMSVSSNFPTTSQYYQHQISQSSTSQSSNSHHSYIQLQQSGSSVNPSMSFPISRSRVISRSNDNLDGPSHTFLTNQLSEPPRLPPQSGVLHRTTGKVVLKPHAFKPVTPRSQSGSASCHSSPLRLNETPSPSGSPPQQNCLPDGARPRSQNARSQDGSSSLSSGTVPVISVPSLETPPDDIMPASCPPPAFANSNGPTTKSIHVIPSPLLEPATVSIAICNGERAPISPLCRSMSDHEMVRQRETELMTLRRTMEQNEEAMLRVFEERRNELERQLNLEQQCVSKLEAALQATTVQLRQTELRLSDCESQLHSRQIKATPPPLPPHSTGSRPSSMAGASRRDTASQTHDDMAERLDVLQRQLNQREAIFEIERSQWLEEKSKVISYQKQMQLNYVQLCSKTQRLESEVQQLTLDLERKDLHLSNLTNGINRS